MSTTASASPPMQELSREEAGFHEQQVLMHCAMHTLNSLVGERWVTVGLLASIARDLEVKHRMETSRPSLFNPYYHWAGPWVGNWDIMVIIEALKARGMEVAHHLIFNPKRPENLVSELEAIRHLVDEPTTVGIIVNERSQNWLMKFISGHHWYAMVPIRHPEVQASIEPHIKDQRAQWVNKDSKLTRPQLVGNLGTTPELLAFLNQQVQERAAQVFVIRRTPQVAASTQQHHAPTAPTCVYPAPSQSEEVLPGVPSPSQLSSHSVATDSPRTSFGERPLFPSPPS